MGQYQCMTTLSLVLLCARREAKPAALQQAKEAARCSPPSPREAAGQMTPGEAATGAPGNNGQEAIPRGGKRSKTCDSEQALKHPESSQVQILLVYLLGVSVQLHP